MDISLSDFETDSLLQIHHIDVAELPAWRLPELVKDTVD
jgi:hypothetical protein